MTEKELSILKEQYNSCRLSQLAGINTMTVFAMASNNALTVMMETLGNVFKWLDLTTVFDSQGFLTYLGNGPESSKDNYTLVCEKLSAIESLLQATHDKPALDAYLAGYKQAIKDTNISTERVAYKIERKEEEENE